MSEKEQVILGAIGLVALYLAATKGSAAVAAVGNAASDIFTGYDFDQAMAIWSGRNTEVVPNILQTPDDAHRLVAAYGYNNYFSDAGTYAEDFLSAVNKFGTPTPNADQILSIKDARESGAAVPPSTSPGSIVPSGWAIF